MKKLLSVLLIIVLCLTLMSACSDKSKKPTDSTASSGDVFSTENVKYLESDGSSVYTVIMVVERGNFESVISTPNLRFGNKFSKKI